MSATIEREPTVDIVHDLPRNDLLIRACRREPLARPPVWLMRQAGRYLPEYREVRRRNDFLTMVHDPDVAAEITVQPVDRVGVDAAILFSDILVIPEAMGMRLTIHEGEGPRLTDPIRTAADAARLIDPVPDFELRYVLEAVAASRRALDDRVPLIGFAGAPWTLLAYMVEGGGSRQFATVKRFLAEAPNVAHRLLERLAVAVGRHLAAQVTAGAHVVQIFESWAGALSPDDYRTFALPYLREAVALAKRDAGDALHGVIAFAPYASWVFEDVARCSGADLLGVDWHTPWDVARDVGSRHGVGLQGNFDPCHLYEPPELIRKRTTAMLDAMMSPGYVANLGHGVLPDTPVEHVQAFVSAVRDWRRPDERSGC